MKPISEIVLPDSSVDELIDPGPAEHHYRTCRHCGQTVDPKRYQFGSRVRYFAADCQCPAAVGERQAAEQEAAAEEKRQQLAQLMYSSGIEASHLRKFTFERWDLKRNGAHSRQALESVKGYVSEVGQRGRNWVWIHGSYGLGKTHLSVAACRRLMIDRLWKPHVVVWPELCQLTYESWSADGGETEGSMWGRARSADVLLIDDLDKTATNEWAMGKLYALINYRAGREMPTIITANKSYDDLQNQWRHSNKPHVADAGMAVLSRIMGQLWGTIEFDGKDQRNYRGE